MKKFNFGSSSVYNHIPYHLLEAKEILKNGETGPNGLLVKSLNLAPGIKFTGEFNEKTQNFEGKGKFINENLNIDYFGDFKDGKKNGEGVFKFSNGDLYIGGFVNDEMKGKGKYFFAESGSVVRGDVFQGDLIRGKGKYNWCNNGGRYEGEIEDGIPHGNGKRMF